LNPERKRLRAVAILSDWREAGKKQVWWKQASFAFLFSFADVKRNLIPDQNDVRPPWVLKNCCLKSSSFSCFSQCSLEVYFKRHWARWLFCLNFARKTTEHRQESN
jgi:hypothetical protein